MRFAWGASTVAHRHNLDDANPAVQACCQHVTAFTRLRPSRRADGSPGCSLPRSASRQGCAISRTAHTIATYRGAALPMNSNGLVLRLQLFFEPLLKLTERSERRVRGRRSPMSAWVRRLRRPAACSAGAETERRGCDHAGVHSADAGVVYSPVAGCCSFSGRQSRLWPPRWLRLAARVAGSGRDCDRHHVACDDAGPGCRRGRARALADRLTPDRFAALPVVALVRRWQPRRQAGRGRDEVYAHARDPARRSDGGDGVVRRALQAARTSASACENAKPLQTPAPRLRLHRPLRGEQHFPWRARLPQKVRRPPRWTQASEDSASATTDEAAAPPCSSATASEVSAASAETASAACVSSAIIAAAGSCQSSEGAACATLSLAAS